MAALSYEVETVRELIFDWIIHSVQRGDTSRMVEPLILQLLQPDTCRYSVKQKRKQLFAFTYF